MSSYLSQFNYELLGPDTGRKWVFLHGLMGSAANWRKITSDLSKTERILTLDQRGHGRSMKPATGYATEDYANDLLIITNELGWEKFVLVGHSMGGRNALMFAHLHSEKLEKLIIEDIGPESQMTAINFYEKLFAVIPTPFPTRREAKEFFLNEFPKVSPNTDTNKLTLGQYLYSNIIDLPDGRADWRFSKEAILASVLQGRAKDHWNELRSLPVETLIIRGENSTELSKEVFEKMSYANPRVRGVEIPNAGHWVHYDQPQEFLRIIKEFVGAL